MCVLFKVPPRILPRVCVVQQRYPGLVAMLLFSFFSVSPLLSSSSPRLHLRALGFCGIDDSINLEDLADISRDYPFVEWGVLFRSDKTGTPRYASNSMLESIRKFQRPLRLAGHLCGDRVVQVLNGDATFARHLYTCGFRRIQVNATSANGVDTSRLAEQVETLRKVIMETSGISFL